MIHMDDLSEVRRKHTGQKLVLTSGTFDLLHVDHLRYLQQVASYGDVVVVLLSSDARVKARKGPLRPIITENDRAEMLEALKCVDYVLVDPSALPPDHTDPLHAELVARLQPDLYVTDGPDLRFMHILEPSRLVILPRAAGGEHTSTSAIIDHIVALSKANSHDS